MAKKKRRFLRWVERCHLSKKPIADKVIVKIVPIFANSGFEWVEEHFEGGPPQIHEIRLERRRTSKGINLIDFVLIIFEPRRMCHLKFIVGTKKDEPPFYPWVAGGSLKWKKVEDDYAAWWGPHWWTLNKEAAALETIDHLVTLAPQIIDYLDTGKRGPNIFVPDIDFHS